MTKPLDGKNGLTAEILKSKLSYDKETGYFYWLVTSSHRKPIGSLAGEKKSSGYILIGIDNHRYRAHRLAWLYMTGEWPKKQVDHRNRIRDDNRWVNLRIATNQENQGNTIISKNNESGYKGIYKIRIKKIWTGRWGAKIMIDGKQIHLGNYDTPEEAGQAYLDGAKKYFGEFSINETKK